VLLGGQGQIHGDGFATDARPDSPRSARAMLSAMRAARVSSMRSVKPDSGDG
jgi:hypothetical protein